MQALLKNESSEACQDTWTLAEAVQVFVFVFVFLFVFVFVFSFVFAFVGPQVPGGPSGERMVETQMRRAPICSQEGKTSATPAESPCPSLPKLAQACPAAKRGKNARSQTSCNCFHTVSHSFCNIIATIVIPYNSN